MKSMQLTAFAISLFALTSASAVATEQSGDVHAFIEGMERCAEMYLSNDADQSFSGWEVERAFGETCSSCGGKTGTYRAVGSEVGVNITTYPDPPDARTSSFHCSSTQEGFIVKWTDLLPHLNVWIAQKVSAGDFVPIENPRWSNEIFQLCGPNGRTATLNIVPRVSGRDSYFEFNEMSTAEIRGC